MASSSDRPGTPRPGFAATATPSGFISRYQVLEKIGEGGMGALFLARDPAIDRLVAIKLLRRGFDTPEARDRFSREARAAGRLRHPNIVTIFDVGEHEGDPFIAMEFLAGETVHELVQAGARLPLSRRLKLLEELCDGLAYAHRAGIIHRDIKPANLIVDSDGVLKILDFGIVRLEEGGVTQAGVLIGTLNYMSPEQVAGGPIDHRSDIFAVGLVAYELLTSRQVFPGTLRDALLNRILTVTMEPIGSVVPDIDPEVAAIVERAIQVAPEDRYPDLARMRNDLVRVRKRIEEAEAAAPDEGWGAGETMLVTGPGVPTPISGIPADGGSPAPAPPGTGSVEAAERALKAGDFRAALTLAGRTAAENPNDPTASRIMARAQSALLERGRALHGTGGVITPRGEPAGPSSATPAPALPALPAAVARIPPLWYAAGTAAVVLALVMVLWISRTPSPEEAAVPARGAEPPLSSAAPPAAETAEPDPPPPAAPEKDADESAAASPPPAREQKRAEPPPRAPSRAASGGSAGSSAATSIRVVGRDNTRAPRRIRYVEPVYPPSAAASGAAGSVGVELTIGRDGKVADARITDSIPPLDEAALAAVRQWEFVPVTVDGKAVPVIYPVQVRFTAPAAAKPTQPESPPPAAGKPAAPEPASKKEEPKAAAPNTEEPRAAPPAVDLRAEEAAVRATLRQYQAAWEARDADAVARLQPLSRDQRDRVRETLESASQYRMAIDVRSVSVEPDGRRARAMASVTRSFTPRVGSTRNIPAVNTTYTLEKRDGQWVITGVR